MPENVRWKFLVKVLSESLRRKVSTGSAVFTKLFVSLLKLFTKHFFREDSKSGIFQHFKSKSSGRFGEIKNLNLRDYNEQEGLLEERSQTIWSSTFASLAQCLEQCSLNIVYHQFTCLLSQNCLGSKLWSHFKAQTFKFWIKTFNKNAVFKGNLENRKQQQLFEAQVSDFEVQSLRDALASSSRSFN